MKLLVIVIIAVLLINSNYAFNDQLVLDRFGLKQTQLLYHLSNNDVNKTCSSKQKQCLWKCCPAGQIMMRFKGCLSSNITLSNITLYDQYFTPISDGPLESVFEIVPGLMQEQVFARNSIWWYNPILMKDGRLFIKFPNVYNRWKEINNNHFCVEMKLDENGLRPVYMVEYEKENIRVPKIYKKWALIASTICLILTIVVYFLLPQLRNQNGVILMIYLGCLIVAMITHCVLENYNNMNLRMSGILTVVFFHYFYKMCSFCWTNVIFYRIARNEFKSKHFLREVAKYCAYAFGLPLFMTTVVATIELSDMSDSPSFVTPQIQNKGNFSFHALTWKFNGNIPRSSSPATLIYIATVIIIISITEKESLYYLYIPIMLLLAFNWVVCFRKVIQFFKATKQAEVIILEQEKNTDDDGINKPMDFVKLLAALTFFTLIDMLTVISPKDTEDVAATFTMFLGLSVMFIFICGQKLANCCCMEPKSFISKYS